ncbi:MAG: PKD domain-containing protein [Pseudomonadota bacterium]
MRRVDGSVQDARRACALVLIAVGWAGCEPADTSSDDTGGHVTVDAGRVDASTLDAVVGDRGGQDAAANDSAVPDGAPADAATDAAMPDAAGPDTFNAPPVAAIVEPASGARFHIGETASFQASCADADNDLPLTHAWDFGDGQTSVEAEPQHAFAATGRFEVSYQCSDVRGASSAPVTRSVQVTNAAPTITWIDPSDGAVLLTGTELTLAVECSDADDPGSPGVEWTLDGQLVAGSGATRHLPLVSATTHHIAVHCSDPWGLTDSAQRTVQVEDPPVALYLSTENQVEYKQVLWAAAPGSPVVLNQALFAPGGRVENFVLAAGDVFYVADHSIQGRQQLFCANLADPSSPDVVSAPARQGSVVNLLASPDDRGFAYRVQQNVANQWELYWVDATQVPPTPRVLNPPLAADESVFGYQFSSTGRYLVFWTHAAAFDIYLVDLHSGGAAVRVLDDVGLLVPPAAFSTDDAYAAVGSTQDGLVLELATLEQATPNQATFYSNTRAYLSGFAFVGGQPLLAYVARTGTIPTLRVVDAAAALAASSELNVEVFSAASVAQSGGDLPLRVCGDEVVFSAKVNTRFEQLYRVNLTAWVAAYRASPGSQTAPVQLNPTYTGSETSYLRLSAWKPDCSGIAYIAKIDHDAEPTTPEQETLLFVDWPHAGAPTRVSDSGSFVTGGAYPDLAFAPDGQTLMWGVSDGPRRAWVSPVDTPAPTLVAATLDGAIDEALWLDSHTLLLSVTAGADAGLFRWDRDAPSTPTRVSPDVADLASWSLTVDASTVVYRRDYSATARQLNRVALATPGVEVKINGDGTANGAQVYRAALANAGQTVIFAAVNDNNSQTQLYAVEPDAPGVVQRLFPWDPDPAVLTTWSFEVLPATNQLLYRGYQDGAWLLFQTPLDTLGPPVQVDLAPATAVFELLATSPSGEHVLFHGVSGSTRHLYLKSLTRNEPAVELSAATVASSYTHQFSPSGRYVAFVASGSPARAFLADTADLASGAVALTPAALPDHLPLSIENGTPVSTQGSRQVVFSPDEAWVYLAYDETYAAHLKIVRKPLPALDVETVVNGPVVDGDAIATWALSGDGGHVVYQKRSFDGQTSTADRLYVVDVDASVGSERLLGPAFPHGSPGVQSYQLLGGFVAMRATDAPPSGTNLHLAALDGATPAWTVNAALTSENYLAFLGVSTIGAATYVAYTAQQDGDAAARVYIARHDGEQVRRVAVSPGSPDSPHAAVSADGRWLWSVHAAAGISDGLHVTALSDPAAARLRIGGVPIASGMADLPSASLP